MSALSRAQTRTLTFVFWLAIFVNAALLFSIQPMFTKMALPLLGGAPAVWNTCLLFFQSSLLAGYLYAHVTSRWLSVRSQALLHLTILGAALLVMPIGIPGGWANPPDTATPIAWLLGLLSVSLGLPFFALSAGAPLLQRWFAGTKHPLAQSPYFLYAASNLGSFVALLAYPFVIEPRMPLSQQSVTWLEFYYALMALMAVSALAALVMRNGSGQVVPPANADATPPAMPTWRDRARWILLSFAPSSLLIGVTTYFTTDIASVPFFWVIPLAIYLLTYVIAFARRQLIPRSLLLHAQLVLGLVLVVALCVRSKDAIVGPAVFHLLTFFVTALTCHTLLAGSRPNASHLTEFYLWLSLGGMLGGVFNVLLAPVLFDSLTEYAIALAVVFALRPPADSSPGPRDRVRDFLYPAAVAAIIWISYQLPAPPDEWFANGPLFLVMALMFVVFFFWKRPLRLALGSLALYGATQVAGTNPEDVIHQDRSFYGTYRVRRHGEFHVLQHGTTSHGGQNREPGRRTEPLTYYHRGGPLSDIFDNTVRKPVRRVAIVGLGAGAMACYGRPDEHWTFYEIDPTVVAIAKASQLFTYLSDCPPRTDIVIGDARRMIARASEAEFDMIVLDAFSSDAVPAHLLTREAVALYLSKLQTDGVLVFHISNRFMDLRPVLSALANDAGLSSAVGSRFPDQAGLSMLHGASRWVAASRDPVALAPLLGVSGWESLDAVPGSRLWTDDFTDVLSVLRW